MNSIQEALQANQSYLEAEISNMIRSHIQDNKLLIVVEGPSDINCYKKFYDTGKFHVYSCSTHSGCVDFYRLQNLNVRYHDRFIVIKDADFDHLEGKTYNGFDNLFLTDTHDHETMMFTPEFSSACEIKYDIPDIHGILLTAIKDIEDISYAKWYNARCDLRISFKKVKVGSVYNGNAACDIELYINKLYERLENVDKNIISVTDLMSFKDKNIIKGADLLLLTRGHDMVDAFIQKIRKIKKVNLSKNELSKDLHDSFTLVEYKKTKLSKSISLWLNQNGILASLS